MKVALVGASGFVGRAFSEALSAETSYQITPVVRETYVEVERSKTSFDVLIHAAMPSKRWWALNHPQADFDETVGLTAKLVYEWRAKKVVLISSVSARTQRGHPYGTHRALAEQLVLDASKDNLVYRLGALYGRGLNKGVIRALVDGDEVFVTRESAYNFIDTRDVARIAIQNLHRSGVIDIGARDVVSIGEIADALRLSPHFGTRFEIQETETPLPDMPAASDVIAFATALSGARVD